MERLSNPYGTRREEQNRERGVILYNPQAGDRSIEGSSTLRRSRGQESSTDQFLDEYAVKRDRYALELTSDSEYDSDEDSDYVRDPRAGRPDCSHPRPAYSDTPSHATGNYGHGDGEQNRYSHSDLLALGS